MGKKPGHPTWEAICQEDSAAVTLRAVSAALRGEFLNIWNIEKLQEQALRLMALGGKKAAVAAVERLAGVGGADPKWAYRIRSEHLASWAVSQYDDVPGAPWDALIIGAANGGVAHLATALGIPFLPQHFLLGFRDAAPLDDVAAYQAHGAPLAQSLVERNSDISVVNHYDPLHDRFTLKTVNYVRCKLQELPELYTAFIYQNLKPGGTIIFIDCRLAWPMYFINERHWFQVGGLGGLPPHAFIEGQHPEVLALQNGISNGGANGSGNGSAMNGSSAENKAPGNWSLKGRMAFESPESEWGTLPPLHDRLKRFARENAYEFMPVEGSHPEYFSYLALRLWQRLLRSAKVKPQGICVELFNQIAPVAARKAALLPLWLPRNCRESFDYFKRVRRDLKQDPELEDKPLFWLPYPVFAETFALAPWDEWLAAFDGAPVRVMGMRPHLYPADPLSLFGAQQELAAWVDDHPMPVRETATLDMLREEIHMLRRQRG